MSNVGLWSILLDACRNRKTRKLRFVNKHNCDLTLEIVSKFNFIGIFNRANTMHDNVMLCVFGDREFAQNARREIDLLFLIHLDSSRQRDRNCLTKNQSLIKAVKDFIFMITLCEQTILPQSTLVDHSCTESLNVKTIVKEEKWQ